MTKTKFWFLKTSLVCISSYLLYISIRTLFFGELFTKIDIFIMEILNFFEIISLLIAVVCLAFLIVQMREVYKGDSDINSLFLPVVILLLTSMGYFAFKKKTSGRERFFFKIVLRIEIKQW